MNELRVDIGGNTRGFQIATEETKRMARDLNRSLSSYTPDSFKGAQMMRDKYGNVFDELKGESGIGGLLNKFAGGFGEAGAAVMELAEGPIGIATAALAAMGEVAKGVWETMRESFQLSRDATTYGMTTSGLRHLDQAGDDQGFGAGEARGKLNKFSDTVGKAALGEGKTAGIFKDMGVQIDGKNMEEILDQVAKAFEGIKDPAEKARRAVELFGRGGQDMIPILHQMAEGGSVLEKMGFDTAHADAVLGSTWQKVHGFFNKMEDAVAGVGRKAAAWGLENIVGGALEKINKLTGVNPRSLLHIDAGEAKVPDVVKNEVPAGETEKQKAKDAEDAKKNVEELTRAQADYRRELEATSDPATKLRLLQDDDSDLNHAIKLAQAAGDEVAVLKLKTQELQKHAEIAELLDKDKKAVQHKPESHAGHAAHVDSMSSAGLFQSLSSATNNPALEVAKQQLHHLANISKNTAHKGHDQHAP